MHLEPRVGWTFGACLERPCDELLSTLGARVAWTSYPSRLGTLR